MTVGSTVPVRPPNQAARAPRTRAKLPSKAPRETLLAVVSAASAACCFACGHLVLELLLIGRDAGTRVIDRDVLLLGHRLGDLLPGVGRLGLVTGHKGLGEGRGRVLHAGRGSLGGADRACCMAPTGSVPCDSAGTAVWATVPTAWPTPPMALLTVLKAPPMRLPTAVLSR